MEIPDCSMPMTFDTYSKCAYNCLYCFAFFQKSHTLKGYNSRKNAGQIEIRSVDPKKVIDLFEKAFAHDENASDVQKAILPLHSGPQDHAMGGLG